ncbi:hypothetical protein AB4Z52_19075 [Rhizobium sp. 2YAF20]|uniref:hypothetical protein n=1 Tax=Rhizobium sp. 2YAF20 TaxID=3233027 RepID=UPI003F99A3DB
MKTQQRSFVVEIKSTRRRSKMQPKSIWGDTDFKALAREAEAEHRFKAGVVSGTSGPEEKAPPGLDRQTEVADTIEVAEDQHFVAPLIEADQIHQFRQDQVSTNSDVVDAVADAPKHRPRRASRRHETRAELVVEDVSDVSPSRAAVVGDEISSDELAFLEEENRHLKWLLAEHLRQQNAGLRKMLERFEIVLCTGGSVANF